jgi:AbrB family looped-hinge helix DNA binding protein
MKTTISTKGQVVLPAELRDQDRIEPGQQFSIERIEPGEYLLKKLAAPGKTGLASWLLRCPEKDWFQPLVSESTATIGTNSR